MTLAANVSPVLFINLDGWIAWRLERPWREVFLPAFGVTLLNPLSARSMDRDDMIHVDKDASFLLLSRF